MAKIKMRCGRCGKKFSASSPKQMFCPECEAKARAERAAAKSGGAKPATAGAVATHAPKIVGPGASILVPGLVSPPADAPPEPDTLALGRRVYPQREGLVTGGGAPAHGQPGGKHGSAAAAPAGAASPAAGTRGGQAEHGKAGRAGTPPAQEARPPREPKPPREPTPRIELTDELRAKIEQRYLELAQPVEFDGIRTRIAGELEIPKSLVKKVVIEVRGRMQMPSWWELQTYTGGTSDLDRIRSAYSPYLPLPPIGVHKTIAQELGLESGVVYQGIKRIRAEMRLPRFNPPELHAGEAGAEADEAEAEAGAPLPAGTETAGG